MSTIFIWFFCLLHVIAEKDILLSTDQERQTGELNSSKWPTHNQYDTVGWGVNTYPPKRVFQVCDLNKPIIDNWIRSPYVKARDAKEVIIQVELAMRDCQRERSEDTQKIKVCREVFDMYVYQTDTPDETWHTGSEQEIRTYYGNVVKQMTARTKWKRNAPFNFSVHFDNSSIRVTINKNFYILFRDRGSCPMISSVTAYSYSCPEVVQNFVKFPKTPAPPSSAATSEVTPKCVPHAEKNIGVGINAPLYGLCSHTGEWKQNLGYCSCKQGYTPGQSNRHCTACPEGTYKSLPGNSDCLSCPEKSYAYLQGQPSCRCVTNYFRADGESVDKSCAKTPSAPRSLRGRSVTQTKVTLTWQKPDYNGDRVVTYEIFCPNCPKFAKFNPTAETVNTTVTVSGLSPSSHYEFLVYSRSSVSDAGGDHLKKEQKNLASLSLKTRPSGASEVVKGLSASWMQPTGLLIRWNRLKESVDAYQIVIQPIKEPEEVKPYLIEVSGKNDSYVLRNSNPAYAKYSFQIRARLSEKGWTNFSPKLTLSGDNVLITEGEEKPSAVYRGQEMATDVVVILVVVGAVILLVILIIMVLCVVNRNRQQCTKKPPIFVPYSNMNAATPVLMVPQRKTYIDPHTYEDPNDAVKEFTREIDAQFITIEKVIGGGEFGDVCKGRLRLPMPPHGQKCAGAASTGELDVAIKTLKPGASNKNKLDFLTEASIMGQFQHANVIYLEGVVTKSEPVMIVTKYMYHGSLDVFLQTNDNKLTILQLVGLMRGVSSGMQYLSEMGYVHRDLAARNILVDKNYTCKVADFGLSRELVADESAGQAYTTKGGKIPVRWTAPEAIHYRKFTSASDCWSLGVVVWEIISYGERPYWDWSNQEVIQAVDKGYRLPPPMQCPDAVYKLMTECWRAERSDRPSFGDLVRRFDKLIRSPDLLVPVAPAGGNLLNPEALSMYPSVEAWLSGLHLEQYAESFRRAGIITIHQVSQLTTYELQRVGITLQGHLKKLEMSIRDVRLQLYGEAGLMYNQLTGSPTFHYNHYNPPLTTNSNEAFHFNSTTAASSSVPITHPSVSMATVANGLPAYQSPTSQHQYLSEHQQISNKFLPHDPLSSNMFSPSASVDDSSSAAAVLLFNNMSVDQFLLEQTDVNIFDRYRDLFRNAGYQLVRQLSDITEADLSQIGITAIGHQRIILTARNNLMRQHQHQPPPPAHSGGVSLSHACNNNVFSNNTGRDGDGSLFGALDFDPHFSPPPYHLQQQQMLRQQQHHSHLPPYSQSSHGITSTPTTGLPSIPSTCFSTATSSQHPVDIFLPNLKTSSSPSPLPPASSGASSIVSGVGLLTTGGGAGMEPLNGVSSSDRKLSTLTRPKPTVL